MSKVQLYFVVGYWGTSGEKLQVYLGVALNRTWTFKTLKTEYCFSNESFLGHCILSGKSLNSVIQNYFLSFIAMTSFGG